MEKLERLEGGREVRGGEHNGWNWISIYLTQTFYTEVVTVLKKGRNQKDSDSVFKVTLTEED